MAHFSRHESHDWCHLCGTRSTTTVDIWYPSNAEYEELPESEPAEASAVGTVSRYIRICADCGDAIGRVGRRDVDEVVRNNPALK
jgi:hypothetical protein